MEDGDAAESTPPAPPLGADDDDAAAAAPAASSSAQAGAAELDAGELSQPSLDALLDALAAREGSLLSSPASQPLKSPVRPPRPPSPAGGAPSTPVPGGRAAAEPVTPLANVLSEADLSKLPNHLRAAVVAHSEADPAGNPHPKPSSMVINLGRILEAEHDREGSDAMADRIAALKPHELHDSADPTDAEALWFFHTGAEAEAFIAVSQPSTTRATQCRFNTEKFDPARSRQCGTCEKADAAVIAFCAECERYLCQTCRVGKRHRVDRPKHPVSELLDAAAEQHLRPQPQRAFDKNALCSWSRDAVGVRDGEVSSRARR